MDKPVKCIDRATSRQIKEFIDFVNSALKDYKYHYEMVNYYDKLGCDDRHDLELANMNYAERARLATKMQNDLRERRKHKDRVAVLKPIVEFMDDPVNKKNMDKLTQLLGHVRKEEDNLENRIYIRRVDRETK